MYQKVTISSKSFVEFLFLKPKILQVYSTKLLNKILQFFEKKDFYKQYFKVF